MKSPIVGRVSKGVVVGGLCCVAGIAYAADQYKPVELHYVDLSDAAVARAQPVKTTPFPSAGGGSGDAVVAVKPDEVIHPKLSGIGGAFNEQGGEAFMRLPEAERKMLAEALFNPATGSGFSLCRTAVGASDFGLDAYSYSETPGDYEMKNFSVDRDVKSVIPFIKAGLQQNPGLKIFASPWSPPGWMKESGKMDGGMLDKRQSNPENVLKQDRRIYAAYALYFAKYVQAYAQNGVVIDRLAIQNETDMNPKYPGCDMKPEQMSELVTDYIRPVFKKAALNTGIWAGTFRGKRNDAAAFIALKGASEVDGIAMQYASPKQVAEICKKGFAVMHSEGKCENGKNTIEQARSRFGEIAGWLNAGTENYCYWNMVLNEGSTSGWGWKQNSLVKIDRTAGEVVYNPDYLPVTLLGRFIRPGDQSLVVSAPNGIDALAVCNSDRLVVFLQNDAAEAVKRTIAIGDQTVSAELPANALCAFVFKK